MDVPRAGTEPRSFLSRRAVARLIAHRVAGGQRPCSAETSAYLPSEETTSGRVLCSSRPGKRAQALDESAHDHWLWKGRRVLAYDGSTVSMPDTAENQQAYPQPPQQEPGPWLSTGAHRGFLFRSPCGAVLDLAICSNAGKGHSELGMLRQLWDLFASRRHHACRPLHVRLARDLLTEATGDRLGHSPPSLPYSRLQVR